MIRNLAKRTGLSVIALSTVALLGACTAATDESSDNLEQGSSVGGPSSWRPGRGFDSVKNQTVGDCVTYEGYATPPDVTGQVAKVRFRFIESTEDIKETMKVSVAASASFLGGGMDAKADFASSHHINSHSVYALVWVSTSDAPKHTTGVKLTDEASTILRKTIVGTPNEKLAAQNRFRERCGDLYIESVITGGEFWALAEITTTDSQNKEAIKAEVNAHFATWEAGLQVDTSKEVALKNSQLAIDYYTTGSLPARKCLDIDCVLELARSFRSQAGTGGVAVDLGLQTYRSLNLPSDEVSQRDIADAEAFEQQLVRNADLRKDALAVFEDGIQNPALYDAPDVAKWQTIEANLNNDIIALRRAAKGCLNDLSNCSFDFNTLSPFPSKPTRKVALECTPHETKTKETQDSRGRTERCNLVCSALGKWELAPGVSCRIIDPQRPNGWNFGH